MIDVHRLRVFRAVVASGSVNAAAQHLGYTPSAVSQHLAALQRETRLTLVEKSGRGIAPTPAGLELAARSDDLIGSLARLDGVVDDLREGRTDTLAVSSFASAAEEWLPGVAAAVLAEFPDVQFTFRLNEVEVKEVVNADIDIRSEDPDGPPTSLLGYERRVLAVEPYVVVVPAGHALASQEEIRFGDLADVPWIDNDPGDSTCGRVVRTAASSCGVSPRFVAYAGDHHGAIAFVNAGIGIAVLTRLAARTLPTGAVARPLVAPTPQRRIVAFVHGEAMLKPVTRRVVELLAARGELDTGGAALGERDTGAAAG
ncbi:LysR family transcriptional regulator [Agilicoccus flavus]|uniref:LysR family transcriptional regulator n=1 Tax=Agilicoccus flavus TaxID=2775968 RepID=UPI001CF626E6|nr:LysR family transcriptional regulator [Agilicoccus flavus]